MQNADFPNAISATEALKYEQRTFIKKVSNLFIESTPEGQTSYWFEAWNLDGVEKIVKRIL